jgi:GDP-L-fucose synthase
MIISLIIYNIMKILVTGGTGLVGYAINQIKNQYVNYDFLFIGSKDCDLTNFEQTRTFFARVKPDYVIHLAAYVGGLFKNMNYKVEMLEKNLLINFNVLKCCHDFQVKKCISCLSTCIFPDKTTYPINETMLHDGPPHNSNYSYAYAKRMLEIHSRAYREQYGDNFICIIPTNIYGPNDNYDLENAHVIPALIHRCYLNKQKNEPFIVRGSGKPLRQFIYSEDLAKLIMWTLEKYDDTESLILSVGEKDEISIETVAREIARNFDYEHMIQFDANFSDGQYKKTADNSKLIKLIDDYEFVSIEEGMKMSVEWFIQNIGNKGLRV